MEIELSKIKKVYCIGIGGIGISALAKMAHSMGFEVSGINDEAKGVTIDSLRELGAEVGILSDFNGQVPEADLYIYSDAWLYRGPEIIQKAKDAGKPVMSYAEALGQFAKKYQVIAVAGTHGKTTTTAMIAEILIDAGLDPTVVVGSFVKKLAPSVGGVGSNFRAGKGNLMVVEADEYMRHFLHLHPAITVITNIESDHLDYYKDLADVESAFKELVGQTSHTVLANFESENLELMCQDFKGELISYMNYLDEVPKLQVPGEHNRMDAAAAFAVGRVLNIEVGKIRDSLAKFVGTWRRLEKKGETDGGVIIYDDYAHHPTEVKASLQGLRELYPKGESKLIVVFQPHLYSRTKALFNEFLDAFDLADEVAILPIYFAREAPDPDISSEKLVQAIGNHGNKVSYVADFNTANDYLGGLGLKKGDVLVTMGAGEAYKVGDKLLIKQ